MHLTRNCHANRWMRNYRYPARPSIRFTEVAPLKLKDHVIGATKIASDVVCIPQMMAMMECFKSHDFDQSKCANEISVFQKCYGDYIEQRELKKSLKNENVAAPGQTKLSKDQLNALLSRYPQPN